MRYNARLSAYAYMFRRATARGVDVTCGQRHIAEVDQRMQRPKFTQSRYDYLRPRPTTEAPAVPYGH